MAAGRLRTAMAFTEPGGGTDLLGALKSSAHKVEGYHGVGIPACIRSAQNAAAALTAAVHAVPE